MSRRVAVLGNGLNAYSVAYHLQKKLPKSVSVTVFNTPSDLKIKSDSQDIACKQTRDPWFNFTSNYGNTDVVGLMKSLHLEKEVLTPSRPLHTYGGIPQLHFLESRGVTSLPSRKTAVEFAPFLFKELFFPIKSNSFPNESVRSFCDRHSTPQALIDRFIEPYCLALFGESSSNLEMSSCFPDIYAREVVNKGHFTNLNKRIKGREYTEEVKIDRRDATVQQIAFEGGGLFALRGGAVNRLVEELKNEFLFFGGSVVENSNIKKLLIDHSIKEENRLIHLDVSGDLLASKEAPINPVGGEFEGLIVCGGSDVKGLLNGNRFVVVKGAAAVEELKKNVNAIVKDEKVKLSFTMIAEKGSHLKIGGTDVFKVVVSDKTAQKDEKLRIINLKLLSKAFGHKEAADMIRDTSESFDPKMNSLLSDTHSEIFIVDCLVDTAFLKSKEFSPSHIFDNLKSISPHLNIDALSIYSLSYETLSPPIVDHSRNVRLVSQSLNAVSPRLVISGNPFFSSGSHTETIRDSRIAADSLSKRLIESWRGRSSEKGGVKAMTDKEMMSRGALRFLASGQQ